MNRSTSPLPQDFTQAFWVTVRVPAEAKRGTYTGKARVLGHSTKLEIPLTLTVHPFALPERPSLYLTNWLNLPSLEHYSKASRFSEPWWQAIEKVAANMAAHRQNVILTPLNDLVAMRRTELGFRCDFGNFDRWIETFDRYGVAELIEGSHLATRSGDWHSDFVFREFMVVDEHERVHRLPQAPIEDADRQYLLRLFLTQVYEHLEERGWASRFVLHLADEPVESNKDSYRTLSEFVRTILPVVRRIDAIMNRGLEGLVDIRVPQLQELEDDVDSRKSGEELWFYTCLAPQGPYPNRFIDFSSLKTRILHWMNWRYRATGYLHWGYNYWRQWQGDEFVNPYYTATGESERLPPGKGRLPPGDPCVVYPAEDGVADSIRWEMVRKGMEDYEYLKLLEERVGSAARQTPSVKNGRKLLDSIREKVVPSHSKYLTDEAEFLKTRKALEKAVLAFEKK